MRVNFRSAMLAQSFGSMIASSGIHAAHYRSDGTVYSPASRPTHRPRLYRGSRDHVGRFSREKTYAHKSRPGALPPASPPNVGRTLPLSTFGERPRASRLVNVCEVGRVIENPSQDVKFRSSSKSGGGALLRRVSSVRYGAPLRYPVLTLWGPRPLSAFPAAVDFVGSSDLAGVHLTTALLLSISVRRSR